jgi:hypothetical protein
LGATGNVKSFDLPAGPAEQTLKQFSAQSGVQLAFATDVVQGIRTNSVRGELPAGVALERMVDGTPLIVVRDEKPGAFAIRRSPNVRRAAQTTASDRPSPKLIKPTAADAADIDWDLWHPELVRTHSANKTNWGVVGHLPKFIQRRLPWDTEGSVFYNSASNFRVADQRYSISGESLPSETGETKEVGLRCSTFNGRLDFRVARFETVADKATVNGLVVALNQDNR